MDVVSALLLLLVIICVYFFVTKRDDADMPPGPIGLPIVGHVPFLRPRDHLAFTRYKKYGPLCTVRLGQMKVVVLNSYEAIHEAFLGQAEIFAGRQQSEYFNMLTHESGIIFRDGPLWQEHRRFTLRLMREFGSGREVGENIVQEECLVLKEKLLEKDGQPVDTKVIYTGSINNVIARLMFGERCGSEDPKFRDFTKHLDDSLDLRFVDVVPAVLPWVTKVPPLLGLVTYLSNLKNNLDWMHGYIQEKINQRREFLRSMDPPLTEIDQASNICEAFIIEQERQEADNPGGHTHTDWQLIRNMFELFLAGTETTSTALNWATLLLAIHPEIQSRVQREIEEKIGRDRSPVMTDKQQLPYVSAVMDEVFRYSSLVPNNVAHSTMKETQLMGYRIPARTMIFSNLYGVHHDPKLWERPEEFYPEHFLSPEGEYRPSKHLIPFSLGKRACLGESLARMEYFLALVTLMQTFSVQLVKSKVDLDTIILGTPGGVRKPLDHEIIFSKL